MWHRAFTSSDITLLLRVRPIVEHDSVVWSPYCVKYIDAVESVQRRFTKRLPGYNSLAYSERLKRSNLLSLELRRLHFLISSGVIRYCLDMLTWSRRTFSSGPHTWAPGVINTNCTRKAQAWVLDITFSERNVNVWNSLSDEVNFRTVKSFTRTIKRVPFNDFVSY